ncbi:MAG TPA: DUF1653 domain-containing protein [Clostridia bacterium]|jgi:hypothetical protein|nr:DUF1653 domain-containing protein [Clostridia bacterium]
MENQVMVTRVYRHFKGNYYFVENTAYDSETSEKLVIYKALYPREDGKYIWVRTESNFLGEIDSSRTDNITGQKHRFELCKELEKNYIQ